MASAVVIVRWKWTFGNMPQRVRPATPAATVELIVRFALESLAWGHDKLQGEFLKVGHRVSRATNYRVMRQHGFPPAPQRRRSTTRRAFLARLREQILACDFLTMDTPFLQRLYELSAPRGLHGPPTAWVIQQARRSSFVGPSLARLL